MNPLQITHDEYGTNPISLRCMLDEGSLTVHYGDNALALYRNAVEIELPPDGMGTPVELRLPDGRVTAFGESVWNNPSTDVSTHTFTKPTSDFVTITVSGTQAADKDTGKFYVKIKPHGGLPDLPGYRA
jgi:hypothetical protein